MATLGGHSKSAAAMAASGVPKRRGQVTFEFRRPCFRHRSWGSGDQAVHMRALGRHGFA
jgi:hypothetical protein